MTVPEVFLIAALLIGVYAVVDSIRRLRRGPSARYSKIWLDIVASLVVVYLASTQPASGTRDLIVKSLVVVLLVTAMVLGVIGRRRASAS